MLVRTTRLFAAVFLIAALTTAAVNAQTPLPKPAPLAQNQRTTDGSAHATTGAARHATTGSTLGDADSAAPRGNIACGLSLGPDCSKVQNWWPE